MSDTTYRFSFTCIYCSVLIMALGPGVLTTEGAQHRHQRKLLNPVFSAAYLRNITDVFYEISDKVYCRAIIKTIALPNSNTLIGLRCYSKPSQQRR